MRFVGGGEMAAQETVAALNANRLSPLKNEEFTKYILDLELLNESLSWCKHCRWALCGAVRTSGEGVEAEARTCPVLS